MDAYENVHGKTCYEALVIPLVVAEQRKKIMARSSEDCLNTKTIDYRFCVSSAAAISFGFKYAKAYFHPSGAMIKLASKFRPRRNL